MDVSGTQCLETVSVIHAAALCTTTSRVLCYIVRKEDKVKRETLLKMLIVLPHAKILEEKLKPTGQYHFWNCSTGLSYQRLPRTTQSTSAAAVAVQHVQKEK